MKRIRKKGVDNCFCFLLFLACSPSIPMVVPDYFGLSEFKEREFNCFHMTVSQSGSNKMERQVVHAHIHSLSIQHIHIHRQTLLWANGQKIFMDTLN
ncbi:hypothetical protein F5H01DRAFT_358698, partial [Linnemannia elongata]